jgi:PAS domain S-box-containing protein
MNQMKKSPIQHKAKVQISDELEALRQRLAELEARMAENLQTVDALQESERNYRILLDESSDPIFTFYPDGQYRYVNKAFADGVGRKLHEIIGKKIWDVFPKDEADKRYAAVKWVFENGNTKVIEVRVPRPDGDTY